ncbi:MAG: DNA polymerase III subunit [FCB group bacterium]|nr:DNA polymerase III subunit [FCB group bacterium]
MNFPDLILNKKIWRQVMTAWKNDKLPHSLLFYGPPGTGKEGHALEIASLVGCQHPGEDGPCGDCGGCRKVASFQHGNVHLILPLPRGKGSVKKDDDPLKGLTTAQLEELRRQLAAKGKDPYFRIELEHANTILINSIRDLRHKIYMTTSEFGWRVILIFEAEKLCIPQPESANALLKILEEPPDNTIFILVTSNVVQMLDTIRSRCQQIYFPPLSDEQILADLVKSKISDQQAGVIAHIADGNIRLARKLAGSFDTITGAIELLEKALYSSEPDHWQTLISHVTVLKRQGNADLENFFRAVILYFRDLLVIKQAGPEALVIRQFEENYKKLVRKFPDAFWEQLIHQSENTLRYLKANGYAPLILTTWLLDMQSLLKREDRRYFDLAEWQAG